LSKNGNNMVPLAPVVHLLTNYVSDVVSRVTSPVTSIVQPAMMNAENVKTSVTGHLCVKQNCRRGGVQIKSLKKYGKVNQIDESSDDEYAFQLISHDKNDNGIVDIKVGGVYITSLIDNSKCN